MNNETSELKNKTESKNLCKRGCGFYGSVQFKDMCSKCYQEYIKCDSSLQQTSIVRPAPINLADTRSSQRLECSEDTTSTIPPLEIRAGSSSVSNVNRSLKRKAESLSITEDSKDSTDSRPLPRVNRCTWCRKRVGLTGFQCRCEGLFCSLHRYSDQHQCAYDYQTHGRIELARANPEVRCPKIRKL